MEKGFVPFPRYVFETGLIRNHKVWAFYSWCLQEASFKDREAIVGCQVVPLKAGQLVFGRKKAAEAVRLSEQEIRTAIALLERLGLISKKSTNKFSIITVINLHVRQANDSKSNQQITSKQPANNHIRISKEGNNDYINTSAVSDKKQSLNGRKITYNFQTHIWENINNQMEIWHHAFPALDIKAELAKMASWLEANPTNRKSNYKRFIHNWLTRSQDKAPAAKASASTQDHKSPLPAQAYKCFARNNGGYCMATWERYKDQPNHMCHHCQKFTTQRNAPQGG
jgi:hypothetical protein